MGLPCKHAIVCIDERSFDPVEYCEKWYYASLYHTTYKEVVFPTLDRSQWGDYGVLFKCEPPMLDAPKRGRRQTKRIESQLDPPERSRLRCGNCRQVGHNRKRYINPTIVKEARKCRNRRLPQQGNLATDESSQR